MELYKKTCSIIIIIFYFSPFIIFSQKNVTVYHKEYCSEDITPKKCKDEALKQAKEEALRKAGIGESIKSFRLLSSVSIDNNLTQVFNKQTFLDFNGFIENFEFVQEPKMGFDNELGRSYFDLKITAKVKKYKSKHDPQFLIEIDSLESKYNSNSQNLKIFIKPNQDCFLKIFYLNNSLAEMIYPLKVSQKTKNIELKKDPRYKKTLERFKNKKLLANKVFNQVNYINADTDQEIEIGKLIFIITKDDIPFYEVNENEDGYFSETDINKIINWYMKIEPDRKNIIYRQFTLHK